MKQRPLEKSKVWCIPQLANLELLRATHLTQSFPRHTHEHYAIGVIEQGALEFYYRGENVVAPLGNISLCIPGEAHTGQPAVAEGWGYRMFYLDPSLLQRVASEMADQPRAMPYFRSGTIADDMLAWQIRQLHLGLESPVMPLLEQETALLEVLASLIERHADAGKPTGQFAREPHAVSQIKDFIEDFYANEVSLEQLSQLTGLSRFHLLRTFSQTVGIPPHAYLRQVRVRRAKQLLAAGFSIVEVASASGFSDQSHLNRWFKRLWGVTPNQYRNSVQDVYVKP